MGKSTISMAIFNSYVSLPEGKSSAVSGVHQVNSASPSFAPLMTTQ